MTYEDRCFELICRIFPGAGGLWLPKPLLDFGEVFDDHEKKIRDLVIQNLDGGAGALSSAAPLWLSTENFGLDLYRVALHALPYNDDDLDDALDEKVDIMRDDALKFILQAYQSLPPEARDAPVDAVNTGATKTKLLLAGEKFKRSFREERLVLCPECFLYRPAKERECPDCAPDVSVSMADAHPASVSLPVDRPPSEIRAEFMKPFLTKRSVNAVATKARLSPSILYRWLSGESNLHQDSLTALATALAVDPSSIPN
jgi:hypothetical protein